MYRLRSSVISAVNISINSKEHSFNYSQLTKDSIVTNYFWLNPNVFTYELTYETN